VGRGAAHGGPAARAEGILAAGQAVGRGKKRVRRRRDERQDAVRRWFQDFARDHDEPGYLREPEDFGFNYDWDVLQVLFALWENSGRDPNALPYPGGIIAQDLQLLEDFATCLKLLRFQQQKYPESVETMFAKLALEDPTGLVEHDDA
jgi:hypothetical protein